MNPVKPFHPLASTRLTLPEHHALHRRIFESISRLPNEKILLTDDDVETWRESIEVEKDVNKQVVISAHTEEIEKTEKERNNIVSALFGEIRQAAKSPIYERSVVGKRLKTIVDTYGGLQRSGITAAATHFEGLLLDLDKPTAKADIVKLHLTDVVELLTDVNDKIIALCADRAKERALNALPTAKDIRQTNDNLLDSILRHIEAAYITTAVKEDRALIGRLIDEINQIIDEIKAAHNSSIAQKKRTQRPDSGKPLGA